MAENEAKECGYIDPWTGKACYRPIYDGKHCIFHSKDIEGKKKDFEAAFWAEFERQGKCEENYDFSGFVFSGDISFMSEVFEKDAYFGYVKFSKDACFYEARFAGNANFWKAQFSGDANFYEAIFTGEADFGQAQFSRNAYFEHAQFNGDVVNFRLAQFYGKAFFTDIILEYPNLLNMIETYLYNVTGLFEYIEKNRKEFKYPDKTEFLPEGIRPFLGEKAADRYPLQSRKIQDDKYLIAFKDKHHTLHFLWWLFADCGRRIAPWAAWSGVIALLFALLFCPPPAFFPDWWIGMCDKIGPCFQQTADAYKGEPLGFWSSLYFSIVTYTTLGFGDVVTANTTARLLVTMEVIAGYIMLGVLISILSNKIARRS